MITTLIVMMLICYFVPTLIALLVRHRSMGWIFMLNLFTGWTVLGWFAALWWAWFE